MFQDLSSFSKEIQKAIPKLCLIVAKEEKEAVDLVLKAWRGKINIFDGENFPLAAFSSDVENLFLFGEPLLCYIHDIDKLKEAERKFLQMYLAHQNPNVTLLLSSSVNVFVKEIKQVGGLVLQLAEEKIWQKRQRMERMLSEEAKALNIVFPNDAIKHLIEMVGCDKEILYREMEKLITYTFPKKKISLEDVKELVHKATISTSWDLGEAIFSKDFRLSVERGKAMIEEGISLFTICAQLRTQYRTLVAMSEVYEKGGSQLLVQEFPYLKGNVLSKKIEEMKKNPLNSLKKSLFFLFETELQAKSVNLDPLFILELLLVKITR